ncbi:hypothetical protein [Immundisolibacter sp.]|uniref:hypothetical protein n=1 Tax=Immundisolibacter sp. TaxID=1934948 RepID=UPI00261DBE3F|nr:hypothetical protein [Immundisolibacter sp.]MDD3650822.1 hypothetical protein [Immundisolibacter sp.]
MPIDVTINVAKATGENSVAEAVVLGLQAQLPPDAYHAERDDGEDVLIKKQDGAADFSVAIVFNTLKGVRINPDKEQAAAGSRANTIFARGLPANRF